MSNIKHTVLFDDFGLDTDSAHRYMGKGSSPFFLNVLKGEEGAYGELTNMEGNRVITYELGGSNTYFVLMSCYDPLTRNVYYYIFSQPFDVTGSGDYEYDNRLIRFNEDSEVIDTIFYDPKNYLGFDPTKPIKDSFVLGEWLYINPRESEPKMLHIEMLFSYTKALKGLDRHSIYDETLDYLYGDKVAFFGGIFLATTTVAAGETPVTHTTKWERTGDCYQDETDIEFDSEFRYAFNVIKHIPVYRPQCIYATDENKHANNVRGKLFRFSHRYKYFDNSYSRYSAFSDVVLPIHDEYYNGEVPNSLDEFNYINVVIPLHSAALVKEIDIIFQETGGVWKRAEIINRKDINLLYQISYTYKFYNTDSAYEVIDDTYFHEPHDSVPKKANSQELINKNILCYGGSTEGFPNIDKNLIDVTLIPEIEAITIPDSEAVGGRRRDNIAENDWVYIYTDGEQRRRLYPDAWFTGGGWSEGDIFMIRIAGETATYPLQAADVVDLAAFCSALHWFLSNEYENISFTYSTTAVTIVGTALLGISLFYEISGVSEVALTKKRGFKTGAWHPFCIFYYDGAMRRWDAQTSKNIIVTGGEGAIPAMPLLNEDGSPLLNEDGSELLIYGGGGGEGEEAYEVLGTTVYVPMFNEISPVPMTTANKWNINWTVGHLPPVDAKWWRWGYAGNALTSDFVQYTITEIEDDGVLTRMNIAPLQTLKTTDELTWNEFPQSIINPYSWQKGDRVRIITEKSALADLGIIVDGVYDYEIIDYDDTTVEGEYWIYTQNIAWNAVGMGEDTLIEIYTPIKTEIAKQFYEFGEIMPIIEDSDGVLVHGAGTTGTQNQDTLLGQLAEGTFTSGDVYHILRTPSKDINGTTGYFNESQWYSDFYDSDDWDRGRIGVETSFGERILNIIRYSNQYLQNTLINGLSTFTGDRYIELNDMFGAIMRIIEIGDTLKVYQRKKPSSIPIGRTQYFDAAGNANVEVQSDRVFGAVNYSNTDYGTEFPESISLNNRYVYGFDIYNGVMWRDAANGLFPISGRYQTPDGAGNYKMETYFKNKSKALLVSGIEGVEVHTVWDQRHQNLYVIFKDIVTDANNDAVVFHEPSNRWICFTDMDQTKTEGWNMPIELDYWITKGFDGGIGYLFDEDTRFATFALVASASVITFPAKQDLTIELFTPTVTASCDAPPSKIDILITPYTPSVTVSYVHIAVVSMNWASTASTIADAYTTAISCSPSPARISAIPSWASVSVLGDEKAVGDYIYHGSTIYIYPTTDNYDEAKVDDLFTVTSILYTDSDSVLLSQAAAIDAPTVTVVLAGDNPDEVTLTLMTGSMLPGDDSVTVNFTISDTRYANGATIQAYWSAIIDGGYVDSFGHNDAINGQANSIGITLSTTVSSGSTVYIYLRGVIIEDEIGDTDLQELIITPYTPDVVISECSSDKTVFTFAYNENTRLEAIAAGDQAVISASSDTNQAEILSIPSWVTIWSEDYGYALYEGWTVDDGETLTIYPKTVNSTYSPIPASGYDYIILASTSDNTVTATLAVVQVAYSVYPPDQVALPAGVINIHSNSTDYLSIIDNAYSVWGLSAATDISYSVKGIIHTLLDYEDYFTVYYRADITRGGITTTDSTGSIPDVQCSLDSDNFLTFAGSLILSTTTVAGDIVTLYFSIYEF